MDEQTRIKKDIKMYKGNIQYINTGKFTNSQQTIFELANQYFKDSQYYLEKKDYFTAFGCINYAHGLLDAIIKF